MEILSVRDLTFGYKDCPVFDHFSAAISEGDFCLIEGVNGAGKTTLMKCLTSLINQGSCIYYRGQEIARNKQLLANLSYVMSEDTLYDYLTVDENISFYRSLFGEGESFSKDVYRVLEDLDCTQYRGFLIKNLSQGTRSKIYMAIMLAKRADVLLLDEPFTALDQASQEYFCELIRRQNRTDGKTVVLVTHIAQFKAMATSKIEITKREV
jgi:ABC-type multidrug transport system ATPase subunit